MTDNTYELDDYKVEWTDLEDGGALINVTIPQEDVKHFASIGMLHVLIEAAKEQLEAELEQQDKIDVEQKQQQQLELPLDNTAAYFTD